MHELSPTSKDTVLRIMEQIYSEDRSKWPYGLNPDGFDGGLYLIREKRAHVPVGFAGFQIRNELAGSTPIKVGYYSIGILPEYRKQGLGKAAVAQLLAKKASLVDCVRALIVEGNTPSLRLAAALEVPVLLKRAARGDMMIKFLSGLAAHPEVAERAGLTGFASGAADYGRNLLMNRAEAVGQVAKTPQNALLNSLTATLMRKFRAARGPATLAQRSSKLLMDQRHENAFHAYVNDAFKNPASSLKFKIHGGPADGLETGGG